MRICLLVLVLLFAPPVWSAELVVTVDASMTMTDGSQLDATDFLGFELYLQGQGLDARHYCAGLQCTVTGLTAGDYQIQLVPWSAPGCEGAPSEPRTIAVNEAHPTVQSFNFATESGVPVLDPQQQCADDPNCVVLEQ